MLKVFFFVDTCASQEKPAAVQVYNTDVEANTALDLTDLNTPVPFNVYANNPGIAFVLMVTLRPARANGRPLAALKAVQL